MNWKQIVYAVLLVDFVTLTGFALAQHGYLGFFELAFANWATTLMAADLIIALGLVSVWMWNDAKGRGAAVLPYLAITAIFGAAGPLLYLLAREHQLHRAPTRARAAA